MVRSTIAVELGVGDDERGTDEEQVAVDAVRAAGARVDEQAEVLRRRGHPLGDAGDAGERRLRRPVRDELDADEQAAPAHVADDLHVRERLAQLVEQACAEHPAALDEVVLDDPRASTARPTAAPAG